ncbi:cyclophilin-type peptidyl-prolyl cis-trans isomerase [Dunaliella salina]|uniref:Peptidyl-prolyl cis-trans isomerase n=1 Tax=Dunaliella salina TaxID=3046 RepID=A0ABQ7GKB3_DUNSA|nr:cyclophilin-type peptidyl-prolyl cis-trans isomerase [Dunaliella salina]|eukprot:KAF5835057.1 cyclophilin-type peptidyl-prolyl cis-trans isomerase [Dunaliella salina]
MKSISSLVRLLQFGLGGVPVESLDEEQQQLLLESIASDPAWASRGQPSCQKPFQLRAGRLVLDLFDAEVPKTTANFKALCTGEKGLGKASKKPLHFRGCKFHRIMKDFMAQGGDVVRGDGSGGDSIYNGAFNDEKKGLTLKHDARGVLSMANSGKNTNTSQFFLTLAPTPHLDGKHVVFGRVCEGMEVLDRINQDAASQDGTPKADVTIAECGIL